MKELVKQIKSGGMFDCIVAISRGGLVPAALLSHELEIRNIEVIKVASYGKDNKKTKTLEYLFTQQFPQIKDLNILLVDDIADTGGTFFAVCDYLNLFSPASIQTVALIMKEGSQFTPTYCGRRLNSEDWITFMWETKINIEDLYHTA